ncbi:hypothetical protein [Polyangium jinanense]|uniref:Lipoprotein n=1 Tax=Polyangium jinanense TaxID=2829994 RepID=A0A9X4AXV3_9BACT|nr:hypothetical protein [Polyangium jinanense]MDC3962934.1 hypothetical protein [Polyangium jinanense]MDC3989063.1 hypothetical protein [Polyangium jinanense]
MRRTSLLLFLLLTACGARTSLDPGSAPPTSLPPTGPHACLADLARTSSPDWERGHACDAGSLGDDVGIFVMVGFDLVGLTSAGPRIIHRFFEGQDDTKATAIDTAMVVRGGGDSEQWACRQGGLDHVPPAHVVTRSGTPGRLRRDPQYHER